MIDTLKKLANTGALSNIDICFARLMCRLAGGGGKEKELPELFCAAALSSFFTISAKHTCLKLDAVAGKKLELALGSMLNGEFRIPSSLRLPELDNWKAKLLSSGVVGEPTDFKPLILDGANRLYLQRYYTYEQNLKESILNRLNKGIKSESELPDSESFDKFFPHSDLSPNWQKVAALSALSSRLSIISGGPGTGKTTTVAAIMGLFAERAIREDNDNFKMAMLAPTGRAAVRLRESVAKRMASLKLTPDVMKLIPEQAFTLHRFLGVIPNSPHFRHNKDNPVVADAVIIDEASMIPLALMAKLFAAIPKEATIILLGDKDQLLSVESGAVMADICEASGDNIFSRKFAMCSRNLISETIPKESIGNDNSLLADSTVTLKHSYRFDSGGSIGKLSRLINSGCAKEALNMAKESSDGELIYTALPDVRQMRQWIKQYLVPHFNDFVRAGSPKDALNAMSNLRLLCTVRKGVYGTEWINTELAKVFAGSSAKTFYHLRPIMITANDYSTELYNGDTGVVFRDSSGTSRVWFSTSEGKLRSFTPGFLPQHTTAYAMTVHKAQGSEFNNVILILPDRDSRILTKELLYTGVTRAIKRVEIVSRDDVFLKTVSSKVFRTSGLKETLNVEDSSS